LAVVGWNGNAAKLSAIGIEDAPIVFRGERDSAGYWAGIVYRASASADSTFQYVQFLDAGKADEAALRLERSITVDKCSFSKSEGYGILKQPGDATPYEMANAFDAVARGDVGND
jgi:hypothetical protein